MEGEPMMNVKQVFRLIALFCVVAISSLTSAYEVARISLEDMAKRSSDVAHVKILAAHEVEVESSGKVVSCGYNYEARVIERLKGSSGSKITFRSADSLRLGSEYVVFASEDDLGSMRRFLSMGRDDHDAYEKCTQSDAGVYVSTWHGETLEFDYIGEALDQQRWLIRLHDHLVVGANVARREVNFAAASVPGEYVDAYSFTALSWADVRRAIAESLVKEGEVSPSRDTSVAASR
jgi:hypothetical protein